MKKIIPLLALTMLLVATGCKEKKPEAAAAIITGAEQLDEYLPLLEGKTVGVMGNQTSIVGNRHLVDVLLEKYQVCFCS